MIAWYILALIAALFSASAAIVEKKVLFKEKALSFSTTLAIFNLILAIPFFFFIDQSKLTTINLLVLFFKSILAALAFLCVMIGIKNLELSRALPLLVLTPGLVAITAFLVLGESLGLLQIQGLILLLIGTYLLQLGEHEKPEGPFQHFKKAKGHRYIIFALILFTITSILDKALLSKFNLPLNAFMGFQHLFLGIIFLAFVLIKGNIKDLKPTFKGSWRWILLLAVFTITYRYVHLSAIKASTSVALVLALKRVSVFFAALVGGKIYKEHDLVKRAIATLIMIIGAVLVILN